MEQGTEDSHMIPMYCPHCERRLKVNPSAAGQIVNCPGCSKRFRIPAALEPEEEEERPSTAVRTRPAAPPGRRPPPPQEPEEAEEEQDFEVVDEPPPRKRLRAGQQEEEDEDFEVVEEPEERPKKRRPAAIDEEEEERPRKRRRVEEDYEEEEEEEERPRKKRRKKRRRSSSSGGELIPGLSNFAAMLIGIVVVWLLLAGVSLAVPPLAFLLVMAGGAIGFAGGIWLLIVAFQDDAMKGVLCLVVPFYALIYVIQNLDTAGRPFLLSVIGNVMMYSGFGILAMSGMHG
jgi:hypothetical protein